MQNATFLVVMLYCTDLSLLFPIQYCNATLSSMCKYVSLVRVYIYRFSTFFKLNFVIQIIYEANDFCDFNLPNALLLLLLLYWKLCLTKLLKLTYYNLNKLFTILSISLNSSFNHFWNLIYLVSRADHPEDCSSRWFKLKLDKIIRFLQLRDPDCPHSISNHIIINFLLLPPCWFYSTLMTRIYRRVLTATVTT